MVKGGCLKCIQAQAKHEECKERERVEREEWECAEWEEWEKIEAARVAAEREEAWKAWRAAKRAEKWKAMEEAVEEAEVVVVDGPSEEARPKKRVRTAESLGMQGPTGSWRWRQRKLPVKGEFRFD